MAPLWSFGIGAYIRWCCIFSLRCNVAFSSHGSILIEALNQDDEDDEVE